MAINFNILRSVLSEPFFISSAEAEKLTALVAGLFTPNLEFERMTPEERAALASVHTVSASGSDIVQRIGVISMRGVLSKYDSLCATGMESYGRMIRTYDADPNIDAIIMDIDSPGGTVAGTEELAATIKAASKPIVAFVNGVAASAAYWIASSCRKIIAGTDTAIIGSIGVMSTWADLRGYYAQQGIVVRDIYAPQSKDKNSESRAAADGNFKPIRDHLSVLADKFHATVRANRPLVAADQLTGSTYFAKDVVGTLVDEIGNFDAALAGAAFLAAPPAISHTNSPIDMSQKTNHTYAALAAAAGAEALESADGSITLTADQAAAVESSIAIALGAAGKLPDLQAQLKTAQASETKLQEELQASSDRIAVLEQESQAGPGAASATITPPADGAKGASAVTDFASALEEARKYQ